MTGRCAQFVCGLPIMHVQKRVLMNVCQLNVVNWFELPFFTFIFTVTRLFYVDAFGKISFKIFCSALQLCWCLCSIQGLYTIDKSDLLTTMV